MTARTRTSATSRGTSVSSVPEFVPGCTDDPDLFAPTRASRTPLRPTSGEQQAMQVCAGCPLAERARCLRRELQHGKAVDTWGVVGGTTRPQRRALMLGKLAPSDEQLVAQVAAQLGATEADARVLLSAATAPTTTEYLAAIA